MKKQEARFSCAWRKRGLRKRYEALRDAGNSIAASLDALIENAPLPRLRAMLPSAGPLARATGRSLALLFPISRPEFVVGILAAGAAAWGATIFGVETGDPIDATNFLESLWRRAVRRIYGHVRRWRPRHPAQNPGGGSLDAVAIAGSGSARAQ
jgi:hypothetical protein